jgi:hypothetical protein
MAQRVGLACQVVPPGGGHAAVGRQRDAVGSDLVKRLQKNTHYLVSEDPAKFVRLD